MYKYFISCLILLTTLFAKSQVITVNQIGYFPDQKKYAIVHSDEPVEFSVLEAETGKIVFSAKTSLPALWEHAGMKVCMADFSKLKTPGNYYIKLSDNEQSYNFSIRKNLYGDLSREALRFFYLSRMSRPLPEAYAGKYARDAGHADTSVIIHESASSPERPAGSTISSPGGWYDAGDYNKYIVNSGISTYSLFAVAEHFHGYASSLKLNIPESSNGVPDVIDEAVYNLRWMLTMQDPNDGGVYHKCTHLFFEGMVTPREAAANERYVVMKSTSAALNLAAVAAQAGRLLKNYPLSYGGLADSCIRAAEWAYRWAEDHPEVYYVQPPDVHTGSYGDNDVSDEFCWAAVELYITTGNSEYLDKSKYTEITATIPGWRSVSALGMISLIMNEKTLPVKIDKDFIENNLVSMADTIAKSYNSSVYKVPATAFYWGSNSGVANSALICLHAYMITGKKKYLEVVIAAMDYLLGRNPTRYSFVTGFGSKPPMHVHDRKSESDGVPEPVPGMLVGGPNPGQTRDCGTEKYPSTFPALSYLDEMCSFSTNEIAINWNAALVYVVCGLEALEK